MDSQMPADNPGAINPVPSNTPSARQPTMGDNSTSCMGCGKNHAVALDAVNCCGGIAGKNVRDPSAQQPRVGDPDQKAGDYRLWTGLKEHALPEGGTQPSGPRAPGPSHP